MTDNIEHRWAVDGIEEGVARIEEDGARMISVPVHLLPPGTKEGQLLRVTRAAGPAANAMGLTITLDEAGAEATRKQSKAVMDAAMAESRKADRGGDVAL